jgi:hypothetical protein
VSAIIRAGGSDSGERQAPPDSATPMQKMAHRLKTPEGKALYALRKQTRSRCSASSNR